ncbi:hypothetical protein HN873_051072, partial [Arachis hypogaea]
PHFHHLSLSASQSFRRSQLVCRHLHCVVSALATQSSRVAVPSSRLSCCGLASRPLTLSPGLMLPPSLPPCITSSVTKVVRAMHRL